MFDPPPGRKCEISIVGRNATRRYIIGEKCKAHKGSKVNVDFIYQGETET